MCPAAQLQSQRVFVNLTLKPHALIVETRTLHWPDESACEAFARALAALPLLRDATIELQGPLGAGKTTWVRHLLRALGVQGRIKSPTYAVLEPYELPDGLAISHLDFYRLNEPHEWAEAGLRDVLAAPGLKLLEWPERVAGQLRQPDLRLSIEPQDDGSRSVLAQAFTDRGVGLLR
jgi:tRNA threonylcarbamoyladenosine biosynthesis protein TsaE